MRATVVVLLIAASLAGCAQDAPENVATEPANVVTDPGDYSYVETDGNGWHVHDYWGGQDALTVMDSEHGWHGACFGSCPDGFDWGPVRPQTDAVVPQGTAYLHITVTWTDREVHEAGYGDVELMVQSAKDDEPYVVGTIQSGVPFNLTSSNDMNDPPHQRLSLWAFGLNILPRDGQADLEFDAAIELNVVAHRGLEIPEWPPHPDHWNGADTLNIMAPQTASTLMYEKTDTSRVCYVGCLERHDVDDGMIVPWDTEAVVVTIEYGPGIPAFLALDYHGADQWAMKPAPASTVGDTPLQQVFRIPLDLDGDSPYALQSLWEFRVTADGQPTSEQRYSGSYTISAVAERATD